MSERDLEGTETRMARPVHSAFAPKYVKAPYAAKAPMGVAALNSAMCRLHSPRESDIDRREEANAKVVGARFHHQVKSNLVAGDGVESPL